MAIQDSNAERRNLTVTSLAFVCYFWGGGAITSEVVRLQVINVKFEHPVVIAVLAWVMLLWFLYRYWLENRGEFKAAFEKELEPYRYSSVLRDYIENISGFQLAKKPDKRGTVLSYLLIKGFHLEAEIAKQAEEITWDTRTEQHESFTYTILGGQKNDNPQKIPLTGFKGRLTSLRVASSCAFKNKSFSRYVAPYVLFWLALTSPLVRAL